MSIKTLLTEMTNKQQEEKESLNLFYSTQTVIQKALAKLG
ncbi:hypothetical protein GCM10009865_51600 [Aeromicrobium ponti]|uniref:Glutamate dehydrogenase n=1 Tax=Cytobacillus oceanisediminis TaxID=665099 RepID=A0A562J6X8_9BACI|nr:glutamate dehydrogenase [Cytobacillus oceanisediminis]